MGGFLKGAEKLKKMEGIYGDIPYAYFLPQFFFLVGKKKPQKLIYCTLFTCEDVQSSDAYTHLNVYIYLFCMYDLKTKLIYSVSIMQMNMLCFYT